jgi:hypothetical protein
MWCEISFSQNYYLKPNPVLLQVNDLISIQKALGLFPSTQTQNNLEWILFWGKRLSPSSECILQMQTVNSSETLLPRPHVILTYTTLYLFTTVKTWSKKPSGWFMQENWITSTTLCSEPTLHDVMLLHFAPQLIYGIYCLVKWKNKVKGYNKTESCKPLPNV